MFRLRLFQLQEIGMILPHEKVELVIDPSSEDEHIMTFEEARNDNRFSWMAVSFISHSSINQCIRIFLDV